MERAHTWQIRRGPIFTVDNPTNLGCVWGEDRVVLETAIVRCAITAFCVCSIREWSRGLVSQAGALPLGNTPVLTAFLLPSDLRSRLLLPKPLLRHLQVCDLKRLSSWTLRTELWDGLWEVNWEPVP